MNKSKMTKGLIIGLGGGGRLRMLHRPYYVIDNKCNKCLRGPTSQEVFFFLITIQFKLKMFYRDARIVW